jgi:hypothetical protein
LKRCGASAAATDLFEGGATTGSATPRSTLQIAGRSAPATAAVDAVVRTTRVMARSPVAAWGRLTMGREASASSLR